MDIPSAEMTKYASNTMLATRIRTTHAEAIFRVTEWKEFKLPNREVIKRSMKPKPVLFDGRNEFDKTMLDDIAYVKFG
jgi:UDP-glucose 6-dehydrogenase